MNKKITRFFIFCILFFTVTAFAEIYQSIDTDGVVTYSDQPTTQSKPVTLPAVNISTQAKKTDITDVTDSTDPLIKKMPAKNKPYTSFTITSPKNQETFQNAPTILVNVSLTPALQSGDKIEFMLDGRPVSEATSDTTFSIPKAVGSKTVIDRGSHIVEARIINASGDIIITTPPVTIFTHYATVTQQQTR
ncbi:MAG: hypothetical protein COY58_03480 [Gammaproteobacteria bacterium CG_4_10_14_0_8_um_filter_38_16]|nr:MAG: hypothetical protein COY58_03480 [Gammaproteobacteria bacterium CG_4_10_14_0_8_um_filter_38_16]PJA03644.1 MAG: hypothetical protein COX72_03865 [Gammaproteobacteria bacterium CG_4_10_14_0_2_um_filter_38_22]PJB11310.1 MAG: hypothetical protein CO120_00670 [Gammaproteobacteria bacterium CG_4_9_14_3_um_filter_38_9]